MKCWKDVIKMNIDQMGNLEKYSSKYETRKLIFPLCSTHS
jgi:hypothetical protein